MLAKLTLARDLDFGGQQISNFGVSNDIFWGATTTDLGCHQ